jgi:hypothetical protein
MIGEKMDTEHLIDNLVRDARAVRPVRPVPLAAAWASGALGLALALNAIAFRCRADLASCWHETRWLVILLSLVGILGFGAQQAFATGYPGRPVGKVARWAYRASVALFVINFLWPWRHLAVAADWQVGHGAAGLQCSRILVCLSLLPAAAILLVLRRLAPVVPARTARFAGAAAAAIGAFGLSFDCSIASPTHFLLYHALPLGIFALGIGAAGRWLLRW